MAARADLPGILALLDALSVGHLAPMRVHVEALRMARVAEFESDGRSYALLAFPFPTETTPFRA